MFRYDEEHYHPPTLSWLADTMTTRSAALITIGLLAALMALVALAALFAGDISERTVGIVSSVLGSFATVLAGLLLFLRVETINTKADDAATHAAKAAKIGTDVQDFVTNGGLKKSVRDAIRQDRHELAQREAAGCDVLPKRSAAD